MDPSVKTNLEEINLLSQQLGNSLYLVGGTIRDHLIGKPCMDYDFTSPQASEIARQWAQKIQRVLVPLDETPGRETYRVVLERDLCFDFTTLQGRTIEEDLSQRDFTINAMAVALPDFIDGKINLIDPFNGQNNLRNQIVRVLPGQTFEEDPLRLLRAFRFASTLGFDIEPQTLAQIETHRTQLNQVAQERITYELLLLLGAPRSRLDLMDQTGLLEVLFPSIAELKTKPGAQPGTTLWTDTRNVFAELESILLQPDHFLEQHAQRIKDYIFKNNYYPLLKWSALIRLLTAAPAFEVTAFLREFRLSNSDIQFTERTLKFSRIALSEARSAAGGFKEDSTVYQFIHRSGNELISSLLLSFAVRLGDQEDIKFFIPLINRVLDFYVETYIPARGRPALLDGDILKSKFDLKPSPLFKSILDKVEEARVLGAIQTNEEAEQLARKLITSQVELTE
jgi:poly(A) polymerase/tRNA nucleotidyltransferase (CCA-adding enzyme)